MNIKYEIESDEIKKITEDFFSESTVMPECFRKICIAFIIVQIIIMLIIGESIMTDVFLPFLSCEAIIVFLALYFLFSKQKQVGYYKKIEKAYEKLKKSGFTEKDIIHFCKTVLDVSTETEIKPFIDINYLMLVLQKYDKNDIAILQDKSTKDYYVKFPYSETIHFMPIKVRKTVCMDNSENEKTLVIAPEGPYIECLQQLKVVKSFKA